MRTAILASVLAAVAAPGAHASPPPLVLPGDAGAASVDADRAPGSSAPVRACRRAARAPLRRPPRRLGRGLRRRARAGACIRPRTAPPRCARVRGAERHEPAPGERRRSADGAAPAGGRWSSATGLEPPAVTPDSPKLALIDSKLDATHPEWFGGRVGTRRRQAGGGRARHGDHVRGRGAHERARDRGRLARDEGHELRDRPVVRRHRALDPPRRRGPLRGPQHELRRRSASALRSRPSFSARSAPGCSWSPRPATSSRRGTSSSSRRRCPTC